MHRSSRSSNNMLKENCVKTISAFVTLRHSKLCVCFFLICGVVSAGCKELYGFSGGPFMDYSWLISLYTVWRVTKIASL